MNQSQHSVVARLYAAASQGTASLAQYVSVLRETQDYSALIEGHLNQAYELSVRLEKNSQKQHALFTVLRHYPCPIMAWGDRNNVLFINHAAEALSLDTPDFQKKIYQLHNKNLLDSTQHQLLEIEHQQSPVMVLLTRQKLDYAPLWLQGALPEATPVLWVHVLQLNIAEYHYLTMQKQLKLTVSEREIAKALLSGSTMKEIAGARFVEVSTVRKQVKKLMKKLGCHSQERLIHDLFMASYTCCIQH